MRWPWTSRVEAAERSALRAESQVELFKGIVDNCETACANSVVAANDRVADLHSQLFDSRAEVKLLLDRIVQMSGQPPIFHPASAPPAPAAPSPEQLSSIPAPETRVSFDDIHRRTRAAIADGSLNILNQPRTN